SLAVGAYVIGCAPRAQATPLFVLCINDSSTSTCQGSTNNWAMILTDGVTTTFTTGSGATTVTDSVTQLAGVTLVSFTGGSVGTAWTINNIQGVFNSNPPDRLSYSVTSNNQTSTPINIFWGVANFAPGTYFVANSGTNSGGGGPFSTVVARVCAD